MRVDCQKLIRLFSRGKYLAFKIRLFHSSQSSMKEDVTRIRNIGIMAHIDAGKTTTTERMLYYSGTIHQMGEVHDGNTVTDYLEQERDRGITITSASVTIPWLKHKINIIDTPGHIDFTFEVEQSLNVIDSAVIIVDGSAGVEAQTVTVWRQADKYNVPRMVYVNKMDRRDSSLEFCLQSLESKFETNFFPLQVPIRGTKSGITDLVDIITNDRLAWSGVQGEKVTRTPITETDTLYEKVQESRIQLIDKLADLDDELTNLVLKEDSLAKVNVNSIYDALRRITGAGKGVPVLCGSSYKNIGVQKLMDAIVNILPSPVMRQDLNIYRSFGQNLCAKAFKVSHDQKRGPITFFRIYSGAMSKNQRLYNLNRNQNENVQKLLVALADDFEEVTEVTEGNIAAVTGLKSVYSGDVVSSSQSAMKNAVTTLAKEKKITEAESKSLLFPQLVTPDPVFFCSIEAPSQSFQVALDTALEELQKEDPSLRVKIDPDTSQTILGGMGELHLEIIKDRIHKKYKVDADIGPLQIAYKEQIASSAKEEVSVSVTTGTSRYNVKLIMSILPSKQHVTEQFISIDKSLECINNTSQIIPKHLAFIKDGAENALLRGSKAGCPVTNARFIIHHLEAKKFCIGSVVASAAAQCTRKLLSSVQAILTEPVMQLEVIVDEPHMHFVMSDLSNRRAEIQEFNSRGQNRIVRALVPLAELLGYSKSLRIGTSGNANFTMEFNSYRELTGQNELEAIKDITGFYPH